MCVISVLVQLCFLFAVTSFGFADDKNGVSPNTISLPEGPGSIEGLGEAFQPMLNTGSARYQVKIPLPAGINGNTPQLSLQYDSGQGNGPLGIGWTFGPGSISRQTDKGIPRYVDGPNNLDDDHDGEIDEIDEMDRFVGPDREELVKPADGTYRARIEGGFVRYRRVDSHWEADVKDGSKLIFGNSPDARLTDQTGTKIYRWLLEKRFDPNGNAIEHHYTGFDESDNQKYLREIRYGPGAGPWETFYFVHLTYDDRPDWTTDYRSGFLVKTSRRLMQIDIGVQGVAPSQCAVGDWNQDGTPDALIRRYALSYDDTNSHLSLLSKVTRFGSDGITYLPPISFSYSTFKPEPSMSASQAIIGSSNEPNSVMDNPLVELIDLNKDGLPDLLKTDPYGGGHTCHLNLGQSQEGDPAIAWDQGRELNTADGFASQLSLASDRVHLADMDGNGISDLIQTTDAGDVYYYLNSGNTGWGRRQWMSIQNTAPPAPFAMENVKTADLDFDKRIDVVKSTENGYAIWFNLKEGTYSREIRTPGATYQGQVILLSETGVHLADLNGDRMNDVVKVKSNRVIYCANMGHGHFDAAVEMLIPDEVLTDGPEGQTARARLEDLNGDGLADLVVERAEGHQLWYWLNKGADTFSSKYVITDMPAVYGPDAVTRWADLNGNGTTDLIYADSTATPRLSILDVGEMVAGSAHPNLLTLIDNGLGVRTQIVYQSSTQHYLQAREDQNPWTSTLPFPVYVVSRVVTTTGLDLDTEPGKDQYEKEFSYRNGYYDDIEKTFRGFEQVEVIEHGDGTAPTSVTTHGFFTGGPDGADNDNDGNIDEVSDHGYHEEAALKGNLHRLEVRAQDNVLFSREINKWQVRNLALSQDNMEVRLAYNRTNEKQIYEGLGTPEILQVTYEYDDFGNVIKEYNLGALSITGDELFTHTEYINDTDLWILGQPKRQWRTDAVGQQFSEQFNYYDGDAYSGLPLGEIEKGNLTRQEGWVAQETYINTIRNAYDPYGNIVGIMDGNGHQRSITYDTTFQTYPVRETIQVGDGKPDLSITADYNVGLGVITTSMDFNGHPTHYGYDAFGRLTALIKPEDSSEFPTRRYAYTMVDPEQGLTYAYDKAGNLTLSSGPATASWVKTATREVAGQPNVFESIQYADGLGRKLALVEEAESGFVVKEAMRFNAKGTGRYTFLPYETDGDQYQIPTLTLAKMETHYDATAREILRINPPDWEGALSQSSTHYLPFQKTVVDENGSKKEFFYDGLERLVRVHEINKGDTYVTRYQYDPLDNLIKITDAQNNVKTMIFDGLKRKTEMNDPDQGRKLYRYDNAGNLIQTTDNKNQVISFTYDGANRMVTEDYHDDAGITPDVALHYDSPSAAYPDSGNLKGQLAWVEDLSGGSFFSYDPRGNPLWTIKRIQDGDGFRDYRTAWRYDAMNRPVSMTWPDDDKIHYIYNERALLESIPGVVDTLDYQASGQIVAISYANGIQTQYTYDPRQRLHRLHTAAALPAAALQDLTYTLDGVGNITTIADGRPLPPDSPKNATQSFLYDDLHRLTQARGPGYGIINYQYDKIGNMILKQSPAAPDPDHIDDPLINLGNMGYGGSGGTSNRTGKLPGHPPGPHAVTGTQSGLVYDYDDNGNMNSHAQGDVYSWNFKDRLVRVQTADADSRYAYDYTGQRIVKRVNDGSGEKVTHYVSKAYEIREGKPFKYVFAGSRRVGRIEGRLADPVGPVEQTLNFYSGWNLFSLTFEPSAPAISQVLGSISGKYTEVWAFDASGQQYLGYVPGEGIAELDELHARHGYLINMSSPAVLSVTGERVTHSIPLTTGSNLVGCPSDFQMPVQEAFASISGKLNSVWSLDATSEKWRHFHFEGPIFLNDLSHVDPGKAYWVEMETDGVLAHANIEAKLFFYHSDHLGSSNMLTDGNGVVVESTEFYPYGRPRHKEQNGFESVYRYTGKEFDKESDLHYFEARYYDAAVERFVNVDPLVINIPEDWLSDPQSLNLYAYGRNNPIKYIDPDGNTFWDIIDVGLAVLSWADYAKDPSLSNLGWALLDTAALAPILPSTGYLRRGAKVVDKIADGKKLIPTAPKSGPKFTYRGDTRPASQIFEEGFTPRGSSKDLYKHALDNTDPASIYVSTSKSADVASDFADNVYVIKNRNGIDVNAKLGSKSPFPDELEIAIPGGVPASDVRAVTLPDRSILNPNYKP